MPVGAATDEHYHVLSEELYYFTAGAGHLRVGDEHRDVRAGECVVIPPGAIHKLTNTGDEPLTLLCCCAPAYSNDDTVLTGNVLTVSLEGQPPFHLEPAVGGEFVIKEFRIISFVPVEDAKGNVTGARLIQPAGVYTLTKKK